MERVMTDDNDLDVAQALRWGILCLLVCSRLASR